MSAVWKYFQVDDKNVSIAKCELCKLGISRGGKEKAAFNTTNLIRHLKNKHPTQYNEFTQATQPRTSQPTLQDLFKKREKMPGDSAKAQTITAKVAQMIAMSDLPFAFVENPGFLMLMEHIEPRFEMPSRHYFTEKALPALHKKIFDKEGLLSQRSVTEILANARKIVGHFKHSPLAYSRLEDIQMDLHMDIKRLQQDVQTRWNSSLYMLQSLLEQNGLLVCLQLSALYTSSTDSLPMGANE
ncbi:hypothetical protein WMY93_031399 [Mugilogobius chulae]|uniref:BED-type domain-containing protein n=1 Tax=Mugilogobius chulae TaxID=88201 RepID=A0AAW0MES2_9GOBI